MFFGTAAYIFEGIARYLSSIFSIKPSIFSRKSSMFSNNSYILEGIALVLPIENEMREKDRITCVTLG